MSYQQISINANANDALKLSDIFFDLQVLSVTIEDQFANSAQEQAIFNEGSNNDADIWQYSKITVLLAENTDIQHLIAKAQALLGKPFAYTSEIIDEQDWVRQTQSQFQAIKVSDDFYIVPSWHEKPHPTCQYITLDPGLAFGTGTHPTTFMCLQWLSQHRNLLATANLLDYGCGSGILAISAKIMGAKFVLGVDIDEQAIIASNDNAAINNTQIDFIYPEQLYAKHGGSDRRTNQHITSYEIVVANILANPLRLLAPTLAQLCRKTILLSGILETQSAELMAIYSQWFKMQISNKADGWVLLEGTRL